MAEPVVLDKSRRLLPPQDYAALRASGLEYIRQLSGRIWTDHNAHDPGITLLEILCLCPHGSRDTAPASTSRTC